MASSIGGFPHASAKSCIGGFLTECDDAGGLLGALMLESPGIYWALSYTPGIYGYRYIEEMFDGYMLWENNESPPIGESTVEFDYTPNFTSEYNWYRPFYYEPEEGYAWLETVSHDLSFCTLVSAATGDFVFLLNDKDDWATLSTAISLFPGYDTAVENIINSAIQEGRAIRAPEVMKSGYRYRVSVGVHRGATTAEFTLSITEAPPGAHDEPAPTTRLGSWSGAAVQNMVEFRGFRGSTWPVYDPSRGSLGQPRLLGCPPADPLPKPVRQVAELDTPSTCSYDASGTDQTYAGPVKNFKVQIPVGENNDCYTLEIESVCDAPMTISGIDWAGWLFNNSRRI